MGDFLLDLRPLPERTLRRAADFLKFFPDMRVERLEYPEFGLVLTAVDEPRLWAPFQSPDGSVLVALCGRVALDQSQWNDASCVRGVGGLACRFIFKCYRQGGVRAACDLSGRFVILICDRSSRKLFLLTDRWGIMPAFTFQLGGGVVFSSHPDALADAVGESRNWDLTSFAEFILTCKLSFPSSYYQRIKAVAQASVTTISLGDRGPRIESTKPYFEFRFTPQPEAELDELLEELVSGVKRAVSKRTLPLLGKFALALSGGLDSRTFLCAMSSREELTVFSFFDEKNRELRTARAIARAVGIELVPFRRAFDFYGDSAALGVRISAGMACIGSNHFLGFRKELQDIGAESLLTGCYCDYVFKGLNLNKRSNFWTKRESLGSFDFEYYSEHFLTKTELCAAVRHRLDDMFPPELRRYDTDERVCEVKFRRDFPLHYEEDSAGRLILQRVLPWDAVIAENSLMSVYLKISPAMRLNRRLWAKAVQAICDARVVRIPDANTGAPVNAGLAREAVSSHLCRLGSRLQKLKASRATTGSWLNWGYYMAHSEKVRSLWEPRNRDAENVFREVLGGDGFSRDLETYQGGRLSLLLRLLTLKLWFDQRAGMSPDS